MSNTFNLILCSELKSVYGGVSYSNSAPKDFLDYNYLYYNDYSLRLICHNKNGFNSNILIMEPVGFTTSSNATGFIQELKSDPLNFYTALLYDNKTDMFYEREMLFTRGYKSSNKDAPESNESTIHNKVINNIPLSLAGNYICNEFFHYINPFCGLVMATDISLELLNITENYYLSSTFIGLRSIGLATEYLFKSLDKIMNTELDAMMKATNIASYTISIAAPIIGNTVIKSVYDNIIEYIEETIYKDTVHKDVTPETEYYIEM